MKSVNECQWRGVSRPRSGCHRARARRDSGTRVLTCASKASQSTAIASSFWRSMMYRNLDGGDTDEEVDAEEED